MDPDTRLAGFTNSNDILPEKLRPALNAHLIKLHRHISSLERQTSVVGDLILDRQLQLEALQEDISAFSRIQNRMLSERAELNAEKNRYEGILAPVRRIPAEVIANILAFALQTPDGLLGRSERLQFLEYRRVSKRWRTTALSTPSLWRGISVTSEDFAWLLPGDRKGMEIPKYFVRYLAKWFSFAGRGAHLQLGVSAIRGLRINHILEFIRGPGFHLSALSLEDGDHGGNFRQYADFEALGESEDTLEITPYIHHQLQMITFVHWVPVEWFQGLTCPSVVGIRVEGDFDSRKYHHDIGERIRKLITDSLPSNLVVIAGATGQELMIRELLRTSSSIHALEIPRFSDFDPLAFAKNYQGSQDDDTEQALRPFLIPSSLKFIRCWEKGTEEMFWSWAESIERYLQIDRVLHVQAPESLKGSRPALAVMLVLQMHDLHFEGTQYEGRWKGIQEENLVVITNDRRSSVYEFCPELRQLVGLQDTRLYLKPALYARFLWTASPERRLIRKNASTSRHDPRIPSYTLSNDPLPEKLRPSLTSFLGQLKQQISALDHQKTSVDDRILDRKARLAALTNDIDSLCRVQHRIMMQRGQAQAKKIQYEGTLSPLRRVPAEVVATILAFALQTPGGLLGHSERRQFLQYRRVSKLWRATALSTPSLWRGVSVAFEDFAEVLHPWHEEYVDIRQRFPECLTSWFSLAGRGSPLQLSVSPIPGIGVACILEFIRQSDFHVSSLSLEDGDIGCHFEQYGDLEILSSESCSYPTITSLSVSLPELPNRIDEGTFTLDLSRSFPNLSTFTIADDSGAAIPITFAHQTLTHLYLSAVSYSPLQASILLQNFPALESLHLCMCTTDIDADDEDISTIPHSHDKLKMITFTHWAPFEWFRNLTCPSVQYIHLDGDFGACEEYSDAARRLCEFINSSLPADLLVDASALKQEDIIRQVLVNCPSIKVLEIREFSDLNPATLRHDEDPGDNRTRHLPPPFLIPSTLDFVRCWEEGSEAMFWSWTETIQRYLRPDQELQVEAPGCLEGVRVLKHYIPDIEDVGYISPRHTYKYRARALFREDKFTFCFYPEKSHLPRRSDRLADARHALRKHRIRRSLKVVLKRGRRQYRPQSAIFTIPVVSLVTPTSSHRPARISI
ncbi:hypothetical protein BKA70DRAFT_1400432 [Coprinopsis sp. MPI-PUGE-AT-0042]|nr:hypothetical protein BKA70DRAFT_1400432 [Coprinopsis sp. MPI-PUGE-AT-0042]